VHCSILEKLKSEGTDDMLKQDIAIWVSKLGDINIDKLSKAILESVVYVANQLLLCKAVLLPWVCNVFLYAYNGKHTGSIKSVKLILEVEEGEVMFTSR